MTGGAWGVRGRNNRVMTFLAPVAGLIAAAVFAPLMVALYLLRLRRRPVRVSSTMLWEHTTHDLQVNVPLRWLRASWLLLLHLAVLAALIAAFARPAVEGGVSHGETVIIAIDRSASMSARDGVDPETGDAGGMTRLEEAKARALALTETLWRGVNRPRVQVVSFAGGARALTGFTQERATVREAIESVEPSDQPADFDVVIRALNALAAGDDAEEEDPERLLTAFVFSDGGFGAAEEAPVRLEMEVRHIAVGPAPADVQRDGGVEGRDNLGIVAISARRDYEDPVLLRVFVRVQNASGSGRETTLELRVDGELESIRGVRVPGASVDDAGVWTAGEATATFELRRAGGAVVSVSLPGGDLLSADDAASVVVQPPARPGVLLVAPGDEGERADPLLALVLEEMEPRSMRTVGSGTYEAMARGAAEGGMSGVDLLVFDRVRPGVLPDIPSISFGANVPIPGLSVGANGEDALGATRVLAWRRTHPVMRYVSMEPVVVRRPLRMTAPREGRRVTVTELAHGSGGPLILLVERGGVRRIVVGFALRDSNWGAEFSFPVFMVNAVDHLTLGATGGRAGAYSTRDPVAVTPARGAREIVLRGPVEARVPVREDRAGERVTLGVLERVGVYELGGVVERDRAVAVNLVDARESALRTSRGIRAGGGAVRIEAAEERGTREVWHWFVLFALGLLTIEWFLYAWRMRV